MAYQTLQKFLKLADSEKAALGPLLKLSAVLDEKSDLSTEKEAILVNAIEKTDMALLIRAALGNAKLNSLCRHPSLNDIWDEKWRLCGLNPTELTGHPRDPTRPIHEYTPQPTIHTFELLKGIFVYGQYKHHVSAREEKPKTYAGAYLRLAAYLGYFPALSGLCKQALAKNTAESLQQAGFYALKAAELYWTPGYFLLAITTYNLANRGSNELLYKEALLCLIMAEKLRPGSEAMINNAYQGKSVEAMLKEAKLDKITETKQLLASLADLEMSWVTSVLYGQATLAVNKILSTVPPALTSRKMKEESENDHELGISASRLAI